MRSLQFSEPVRARTDANVQGTFLRRGSPNVCARYTKAQSAVADSSVCAAAHQDHKRCPKQDQEVKPDGPPLDIREVEVDHLLEAEQRPAAHLPQASQAGGDGQPQA